MTQESVRADFGLRAERQGDADVIRALTAAAFRDVPYSSHTEQFIVDALRRAGALSVSLVAEIAGEVIAHVAVSPVSIADGCKGWYGLGPISVRPLHQRQGVGTALMQAALQQLRDTGAKGCVVLGGPAYYGRFGFRVCAGLVLPGVPPAYFLALAFGAELPQGEVRYHPAFDARA